MATGIGERIGGQVRDMVRRARHYWAELTDEKDLDASGQKQRADSIHQRFGEEEAHADHDSEARYRDHQESSQDQGMSDAERASAVVRAARRPLQTPTRPGHPQAGAAPADTPRTPGVASRQYTQQGGSGIQKTLGEQLASGRSEPAADNSGPAARSRGSDRHH